MRYVCVGAAISRPVVFPTGKQRRRKAPTIASSNILRCNSVVSCRNMVHCGTMCRAIPGGNRRADDIRPYDGVCNSAGGCRRITTMKFRCVVGADIIRPVVSPWETTSAQCADNTMSNILQHNSVVSCRNMVYFATLLHFRAKSVLPRNLPRWWAADSRPYMACAAESAGQKFRCSPHLPLTK